MDFVIGLPKSKDWQKIEYNLILVIVDRLIKMVYYKPVLITLDAKQLAELLIETLIKYHGLVNSIALNQG